MSNYTFSYFSGNQDDCEGEFPRAKSINTNVEFDDASAWDAVLREFLDFLSSIYGYDISKSVDVKTFEQRMAFFANNEED